MRVLKPNKYNLLLKIFQIIAYNQLNYNFVKIKEQFKNNGF